MIIAVTGNRKIKDYQVVYEAYVQKFLEYMPEQVIAGCADGTDLAAAEAAIDLKIPLISARPWKTHKPSPQTAILYDWVMENSEVHVIDDSPYLAGPWIYQRRNEWMVDRAQHVLAWWDGGPGGTKNCLNYAIKKNVPWENLYAQ